jgi:hypothetical protein
MSIPIPAHLAKLILADEHYHRDRAEYYYRLCLNGADILLKSGAKLNYTRDGFEISGYDWKGEDVLPYVHEYGLEYLVD